MRTDDRGLSSVAGKILELGIVALYVSVVAAVLFGGVVPEYRTVVGDQLADRTLAAAASDVESAVPPPTVTANRTLAVDVPATIRGESYRITAANETLALDHPDGGVGGRTRLAVARNVTVAGTWRSGEATRLAVRATANETRVRLTTEAA